VPIDEAVIAAEQRTINLYVRNGLIPKRLEAAEILDPSFNAVVVSGSKEAALR
jgi:sulfonate transport system substrate-binding protein